MTPQERVYKAMWVLPSPSRIPTLTLGLSQDKEAWVYPKLSFIPHLVAQCFCSFTARDTFRCDSKLEPCTSHFSSALNVTKPSVFCMNAINNVQQAARHVHAIQLATKSEGLEVMEYRRHLTSDL